MFAIEQDLWLTQTMGRPAFRVDAAQGGDAEPNLDADLRTVLAAPGFYYCKIATSRVDLCNQVERCGFRLIDTNISLEAPADAISAPSTQDIRLARAEDCGAVVRVARSAFTQSRFHLDPRIPRELANELKGAWAGNYFEGKRGQFMVVAAPRESVTGFLQLLSDGRGTSTIDLIGVDAAARGLGYGRSMISFAAKACGAPSRVRVGTQAANVRSLRFYENLGFRMTASSYVFHLHQSA